jgi:hypothetical protein
LRFHFPAGRVKRLVTHLAPAYLTTPRALTGMSPGKRYGSP